MAEGPEPSSGNDVATRRRIEALVDRAGQLRQRGRLQDAYQLYLEIVGAQPNHAEANHELGLLLRQAGRFDEAATRLRHATRMEPRNAIYLSNLGVALMDTGASTEAIASYEAALRLDPTLTHTRSNLGVALFASGQVEAAIAAQRAAIAEAPDFAEAHANLGRALLEKGATEAAIASFDQAIALKADYANAHYYLATAVARLGNIERAEAAARQAIALQPRNAAAHHLLARLLAQQSRLDEAIASERRALELKPDAAAYCHLGELLYAVGDDRKAVIAFRAGLALDDKSAPLHAGLGRAQYRLGGMARAVESFRNALALDPDNTGYRAELAPALVGAGLLDEATAYYRASAETDPTALGPRGALVFLGNYAADTPAAEVTRQAALYGEALAAREAGKLHLRHANTRDPDRSLRIGLVSGDLNQHPVAFFLENALRAIDPTKIELFAYATSSVRDEVTARLERIIPNWRDATRLDDDALDQAIVGDGIDILVDLAGHTQNARLAVFARKPAPIGVTWLGYSGTTGVKAIDYLLADRLVAPAAEEGLFTEAVWRLPDSYLCYSPPAEAPDVAPLPAHANGYVTFGSFNNLNKVNDRTLALWARLLVAVPDAKLAFKGGALRRETATDELRTRFAAVGGDPDRLKILPYESAFESHLAAYQEIDIGLDPFPYNGTTTTCEALFMGVPVLALRGDRFIGHVGESLLTTVGLADWVGGNADDFIAKAAAYAADLAALETLRGGFRPRLLASPLTDAPRFARHLDEAFRAMWQRWCTTP